MITVAITGANGFVGRALVRCLAERGINIRALVRDSDSRCTGLSPANVIAVGDMTHVADWRPFLERVDAVVHLAARVHQIHRSESAGLYVRENVEVTRRLVENAAAVSVRHFVFVSSIKVNGERTVERPFTATDAPSPEDAYGRSKLEAETCIRAVAQRGGMRATIIRPPLVHGPGVGANFRRLLQAVHDGIPFPLRSVANHRSMVSVWNLADLIRCVIARPGDPVQTLLVADDESPSTPDLIRRIGKLIQRRVWLAPVPVPILKLLARGLGRQAELARLTDSLVVDSSETRRRLQWTPPLRFDDGLADTVADFVRNAQRG